MSIAVDSAVVLIAGSVIQTVNGFQDVAIIADGFGVVPRGPVTSQEVINLFGTSAGGLLEPEPGSPRYLLTESGMGYRFSSGAPTKPPL